MFARRLLDRSAAIAATLAVSIGIGTAGAQTSGGTVRLGEIARQDMFVPLYGALGAGLFRKQGLRVSTKVTLGPDTTMAALIGGEVDFALGGIDTAILSTMVNPDSRLRAIAAIAHFEGSYLVAQERIPENDYRWDMLAGKSLMGWRRGTYPSLFVEGALRKHKIDPAEHIRYRPNIPFPARERVWRKGRFDFAVFYLVDAVRFEREGIGFPIVPFGREAGPSAYGVLLARESYIKAHPETVQKFVNAIQAALDWTATAPVDELAETAAQFLRRAEKKDLAEAYRRYRSIDMWKTDATVSREAVDRVQDMMLGSGAIRANARLPYEEVVEPRFAEAAKRAAGR